MRGVGPTTRASVRRFTETGEPRASEGSSIGAAMRALPFGWATPVAATGQRRELTVRLSALDSAATTPMWEAAHGDWASPKRNMSLDAVTTMAIVLHVLRQATGMASAMNRPSRWGVILTLPPPSSEGSSAPRPETLKARFRGYPASCCLSRRWSRRRQHAMCAQASIPSVATLSSVLMRASVMGFSTSSRPALRAAACGGRPRPGSGEAPWQWSTPGTFRTVTGRLAVDCWDVDWRNVQNC
jgi:hypothetical protein